MRVIVQRVAWVALTISAFVYVAMMWADFRAFGAPVLPIDLLALVSYYLPWWLGWMPLLGVWCLVHARMAGGGSWGWRWGVGIVLILMHVRSLGGELLDFRGGPNFWAEPYWLLKEIPVALAVVTVSLLAWRGERWTAKR